MLRDREHPAPKRRATRAAQRAAGSSRFRRSHRNRAAVRSTAIVEREHVVVVELITADRGSATKTERARRRGRNSLGELPLVHIQNAAVPFEYAGASDVEPLMPLQDELNTRLSDRANRITMQSFKMYLGKGIENFTTLPVAPGRMWMTDNDDAEVIEFGGDAACPSEDAHIAELREAMDKTSGVTPIAAGAIKGRIGRLTSAAALRVTMLALLAKTEKKRTTYGAAIERMCELALAWLDRAGLFRDDAGRAPRRDQLAEPAARERAGEARRRPRSKLRLGVPQRGRAARAGVLTRDRRSRTR